MLGQEVAEVDRKVYICSWRSPLPVDPYVDDVGGIAAGRALMRARGLRRIRAAVLSGLLAGLLMPMSGGGVAYAAASSHLLRYSYLSDVTATSAVVNFATDASSTAAVVTFGPASSGCAGSSVTAATTAITVGSRTEYQFKAQLSGLNANTLYCYRAAQNGVDLLGSDAAPTFTTALAPGDATPYSFAVLGDWGAGTSDEANVLAQIAASPAKFVVTVGDNVYNSGTQTEYGDLSGGNVFAPAFWKGVGATRPVFAAQGNHGFSQNLPYLQNFPEPNVVQASGGRLQQDTYCCIPPMPGSKTYASAWYAFDWGAARFYVLEAAWSDSNGAYQGDFDAHWNGPVPGCAACGTELQWLQSDLAAHASTAVKFAFFHYPLHADSSGQPSDTYLDGPNGLEGLLARNGVQVAFNGHAHMYERNRPQISGSSMVSYVTGGGGDALGSVGGCSAFDAYAIGSNSSCNAPNPTSATQVFHYLLVSVARNTVTVTPTDELGRTFDVQTYSTNAVGTTTIDSGPAALTRANTATFAFHSTASGATFTCTLDSGAPSPCTSPVTLNALTPGGHTFTVATTVPSGPNPAPVSFTWTIDTAAPSTPSGLAGNASSPTTVNLTWNAARDNTGVVGYDIARNGVTIGSVGGTTTTFVDATASPATSYQYAVDARDGAGNVSSFGAPASVTTPSSNDFSIGATPSTLTVTAGQSAMSTINTTVTTGAAQSVALSTAGLPSGATASFNPATITSGQSATLTITTSASTPTGTSSLTVTGTGTSATHTTPITLTITAPVSNNFSIGATPSALTVTAGQSATSTINTTVTTGAAQSVALSAAGLPSGATASFNPSAITSGQSATLTITTSASTPTGTSSLTITGTGTSATHTTPITLTVSASGGSTQPKLVQATGASETSAATSLTGTFSAPTASGHLLVLSASVYTGITNPITSVTDSAGNTWTRIGAFAVSGHYSDGEMWYSANAAPVTTVTVHTASAAVISLELEEFSGIATTNALDVSAGTSNSSTSPNSGTATPTGTGDLVVGFIAGHNNGQSISVTSPGYTAQTQQTSSSGSSIASVITGYQILTSANPQSFTGNFSSSMYWAAGIVCFKAAP